MPDALTVPCAPDAPDVPCTPVALMMLARDFGVLLALAALALTPDSTSGSAFSAPLPDAVAMLPTDTDLCCPDAVAYLEVLGFWPAACDLVTICGILLPWISFSSPGVACARCSDMTLLIRQCHSSKCLQGLSLAVLTLIPGAQVSSLGRWSCAAGLLLQRLLLVRVVKWSPLRESCCRRASGLREDLPWGAKRVGGRWMPRVMMKGMV